MMRSVSLRVALGATAAIGLLGMSMAPALASSGPTASLTVEASSSGVATAKARIALPTRRTVDELVIAVRDERGRNFDYPLLREATIGPSGKAWAQQRSVPEGRYVAFVSYSTHGRWHDLRPQRSFVVGRPATTPSSRPTSSTAPSRSSVPVPSTARPSTVAPPSSTSGTSSGPTGVGWKQVFGDDFSGSSLDRGKWSDTSSAEPDGGHGNLGNQQLEWNQASSCTVAGGTLTMTAERQSFTSPSGQHYSWTSCLLTTSPSFSFRYGYIEERSKLPAAKGFWPAFWTWQADGVGTWIETDAYEYYSDNPSKLYLSQHSSGESCTIVPGFDPADGFHTYAADIEPGGTTFFLDGKKVCATKGTSAAPTNIITNLAVYSRIPPDARTTSATKVVDWVRAWQR